MYEETHLLVLEAEEEHLLHDGKPRRLASEPSILILALEVARVIGYLATAFERGAGMMRRGMERLATRDGSAATIGGGAVQTPCAVGVVVAGRGRGWDTATRETSSRAHGMNRRRLEDRKE